MKDFGNRRFRIGESSFEVKLVYTGFLIFAFLGYFTIALLGFLRVGPGYGAIVTHYRGSELEEAALPRPIGQMLEEAHFHAFIEGVILLVLSHLFAATGLNARLKIWIIVLAFGSTLSDLACPWLIQYVAPGFAALQIVSWIVMGATALIMIAVPLYEMWGSGSRARPES